MAERAISRRKSQFLVTFAPAHITLDELIREKLIRGKFPFTKTAWIKILAMIISLASLALFLAQSTCEETAPWFPYMLPVTTGLSIVMLLFYYLIFSCGATIRRPGKWVSADIISNVIAAIAAIIGGGMTWNESAKCKENQSMHGVPGPVAIVGGIMSLVSCAAIFLMYRYVEEESEEAPRRTNPEELDDIRRKSMHV